MSKQGTQVVTASNTSSAGFIEYDFIDVSNWKPQVNGERLVDFSFHKDTLRKIMGKMLTVVDACIADERQNKAMKDLVRAAISEEMSFSSEMAFDQEKLQKLVPETIVDETPRTIEEVLAV